MWTDNKLLRLWTEYGCILQLFTVHMCMFWHESSKYNSCWYFVSCQILSEYIIILIIFLTVKSLFSSRSKILGYGSLLNAFIFHDRNLNLLLAKTIHIIFLHKCLVKWVFLKHLSQFSNEKLTFHWEVWFLAN